MRETTEKPVEGSPPKRKKRESPRKKERRQESSGSESDSDDRSPELNMAHLEVELTHMPLTTGDYIDGGSNYVFHSMMVLGLGLRLGFILLIRIPFICAICPEHCVRATHLLSLQAGPSKRKVTSSTSVSGKSTGDRLGGNVHSQPSMVIAYYSSGIRDGLVLCSV